ncbi:MAG: DNA polymerase III subunit delta' [Hyphomonadaceae bacterium]|nr:DNA polymerase III subunit delta' [Hyphomonadaceae bacterium]
MSEAQRPADTYSFVGHEAAEAAIADALKGGRMHHAWLIAGPKGLGKATLAFRAARAALGARVTGPRPLDVAPDDPVARRIAANAHADFFLLERGLNERGKLRRDISAEDARKASGFFSLSSAEGGRRVVIVDAVDELNRFGANALLKTLEEPPPQALLFLVCHAPGAALATIRSRCRRLDLRPLGEEEMKRAVEADSQTLQLAGGRPGRARALMAAGKGGAPLSHEIALALSRLEKEGGRALLDMAVARGGEDRLPLTLDAVEDWIRAHATRIEGPQAVRWASAYSELEALRAEADDLDMDPAQGLAQAALILDRAAARRA